ncbi:unnamed protein product [Effrenium voratum]|nr:unnamed protein product [Effrenium voratum]
MQQQLEALQKERELLRGDVAHLKKSLEQRRQAESSLREALEEERRNQRIARQEVKVLRSSLSNASQDGMPDTPRRSLQGETDLQQLSRGTALRRASAGPATSFAFEPLVNLSTSGGNQMNQMAEVDMTGAQEWTPGDADSDATLSEEELDLTSVRR